jgi:hypothetical protein
VSVSVSVSTEVVVVVVVVVVCVVAVTETTLGTVKLTVDVAGVTVVVTTVVMYAEQSALALIERVVLSFDPVPMRALRQLSATHLEVVDAAITAVAKAPRLSKEKNFIVLERAKSGTNHTREVPGRLSIDILDAISLSMVISPSTRDC